MHTPHCISVCDHSPMPFWCLLTVPPTQAAPGSGSLWSSCELFNSPTMVSLPSRHGATSPTQDEPPSPHVHSPPHSPTECAPWVTRFTSGEEHSSGSRSMPVVLPWGLGGGGGQKIDRGDMGGCQSGTIPAALSFRSARLARLVLGAGCALGTSMCSSFHLTPQLSSTPPEQRVPFQAQPRWAHTSFLRSRMHLAALAGTPVGGVRKLRPAWALVVPIHHASMKACSQAFSSFANCCTARACGCKNLAASQSLPSVARDSATCTCGDSSHCEQPEQVKPHVHFFSHGKELLSHSSLHGFSETPAFTMALK